MEHGRQRARARGARRRLRRHRHEPALRAQGVRSRGAPASSVTPRERPRRPLADLLGADPRGDGQVRRLHHARRQPRRGRHPGAAGARAPTRVPSLGARRGRCCSGCSAPRSSTATASSRRRSPCSPPIEGLEVASAGVTPVRRAAHLVILTRALRDPAPRHRTASASAFGPVMLVWFVAIGRARRARRSPATRRPARRSTRSTRSRTSRRQPWIGVRRRSAPSCSRVTGVEALYADMGHFGARPIAAAWFARRAAGLLLSYFGQGALVLARPGDGRQPVLRRWSRRCADATRWSCSPPSATVIASQALISGAFSLTQQAIQLGYLPRMTIRHTSGGDPRPDLRPGGQLAAVRRVRRRSCSASRSSAALAAAYGIAVTGTMADDDRPAYVVTRAALALAAAGCASLVVAPLLAIDLAFFGSNLLKILHGGWFPLLLGGALFVADDDVGSRTQPSSPRSASPRRARCREFVAGLDRPDAAPAEPSPARPSTSARATTPRRSRCGSTSSTTTSATSRS